MHDTNLLEDQPIAWTPTPDVIERAQLTRFMRQVGVTTWDELYDFSIRDVEKFTEEVLKFLDIKFDPPYKRLMDISEGVEFPRWFSNRFPQSRKDAKEEDGLRQQESEPGAVATGSAANAERGVRNAESHLETRRRESEPGAVATGSFAGLNITTMCLDRWQTDEMKDQPAVIWEGEEGEDAGGERINFDGESFSPYVLTYTYAELFEEVRECSEGLRLFGFSKGDAIGVHLPMMFETVVCLLAINRIGALAVPVFSGYGVEAIASRMNAVGAKAIFTCDYFPRRGKKFDALTVALQAADTVPTIERIFTVRRSSRPLEVPDTRIVDYEALIEKCFDQPKENWDPESTSAEDPLIILYTSGTTGKPKGIAHTHASFPIKAAQDMAFGTDVGRGTRICWYTDIGWMMGPWLIYGALINGATICIYDGAPDYPTPDRMWEFCAKHKVEILGISPTLVRALAAHEDNSGSPPCLGGVDAASADGVVVQQESDSVLTTTPPRKASAPLLNKEGSFEYKPPHQRHDISSLRAFASTGEPWNPAPWWWLFKEVGNSKLPIINYSGGTEIAGGILMGNPLLPIKPCSFPAPCPGMDVDILDEEGNPVGPNQVGELVIKQPWIGMARGFWQERERYLDTYWRRFPNIWVHGDWAMRDKDGHWFILGRSDDTLKVAGKRVGPAEVESLLVAHPLVTEAAVIGVPDEAKGTAMVAFCVLSEPGAVATGYFSKDEGGRMKDESSGTRDLGPGTSASSFTLQPSSLEAELKALVAKDMGKPLAPSRIHFVSALPKTRNAKVMRRVIRAAYLGEDPGDLSALEDPQAVTEVQVIDRAK